MKQFLISLIVAAVLTSISYAVGLHFNWIKDLPWLEAASVFTAYSCTYLCVQESKWNFPVGILSVVLSAILFFDLKLYSSMVLNLYLIPVLIVGWYTWDNRGEDLPVTNIDTEPAEAFAFIAAIAGTYVTLLAITNYLGATLSGLDSAILILSITAQYLLTAKKIENWFVWFVVNNIAIFTYFSVGAYLMGIQYVFFLLNTMYGYWSWNRNLVGVAK